MSFNSMAAVTICSDFGAPKIKAVTVSTFSPSICHEVMGLDAMILVFGMLSFKPASSPSSCRDGLSLSQRPREEGCFLESAGFWQSRMSLGLWQCLPSRHVAPLYLSTGPSVSLHWSLCISPLAGLCAHLFPCVNFLFSERAPVILDSNSFQ